MNSKLVLAVSVLSFLISVNLVSALAIYIQPANQGIVRLNVSAFQTATAKRSFEIRNTNNFSLTVSIQPDASLTKILDIEKSFDLQENESRIVNYTVKVSEAGNYSGNIEISFSAPEGYVTYQSSLRVIATKSELNYSLFLIPAVALVAVLLVAVLFIVKRKRAKK